MHEQEEFPPLQALLGEEPPMDIDFVAVAVAAQQGARRRRRLAIGAVVLATSVIAAGGLLIGANKSIPTASAPGANPTATASAAIGTWTLTGITRNGQPIVTQAELAKFGFKVKFELDPAGVPPGTFGLDNGDCGIETGRYTVSSNKLTLKDVITQADACGFTSSQVQHFAETLGTEINRISEAGDIAIAIATNADQLTISAGADQYTYVRAN